MAIQSEHESSPREDFCAVRVRMNSNPRTIYDSWTKGIDRWFAAPGSVHMDAKDGGEYSFETEHEGTRHPHHGRFLHLEKDRLLEMTWVTGEGGTEGAETVVSIEIAPEGTGPWSISSIRGFRMRHRCSGTSRRGCRCWGTRIGCCRSAAIEADQPSRFLNVFLPNGFFPKLGFAPNAFFSNGRFSNGFLPKGFFS